MKDFKLQEEELIASFRPDLSPNAQPPPHPQPQPQLVLSSPQPQPILSPPHPHHVTNQVTHIQHKQQVVQQNSRPSGPPVVFNLQQPHHQQQNNGIHQVQVATRQIKPEGQRIPQNMQVPISQGHTVQYQPQPQIIQGNQVVVPQNQSRTTSNQPQKVVVYQQNIQRQVVQQGTHPAQTRQVIIQGQAPPQQTRSYSQQPIIQQEQLQNIAQPPMQLPQQYRSQEIQPQQPQPQPQHHQTQPAQVYQQKGIPQPTHQVHPQQPQPKQQPQQVQVHQQVQYVNQQQYQNVAPQYQGQALPPSQERSLDPNQPEISQTELQQQQYNPQGIEHEYEQYQDINQLPPEQRHRLWMEQQQQQQMAMQQQQFQQGQYEYPPGEEGNYEYPPEYYQQQAYEDITPQMIQNLQGQATLWRERFFYLYERYQNFYDKYEVMHKEGAFLVEQFLSVDSEQEWLALKQKYDSLTERMGQVKQQNTLILQQIQQNVQQNQKLQNEAINQQASRVWEHRYQQLLEQYESLSHHYAELQSSSMAHNDMDENERVSMMNQKYGRLEAEYNHVVQQLQDSEGTMKIREEHQELLKYTQQLQAYIEQLETDNNNLVRMKTSVDNSKTLPEQQIAQKIVEKDSEIRDLTQVIANLQEKVKQHQNRPKSSIGKDVHTSQLQNQVHEMNLYVTQLQQKLSMKEYEINGLKDKIQYLEEELHHKNEEIFNHNKYLQQKISKIQNDISAKRDQPSTPPPQPSFMAAFNFQQDYQNRLREYQRSIQSKNNQIRILEDRITESQSETRKLSLQKSNMLREWQERVDQLEEDSRKKSMEKDSKIRKAEFQVKEKEMEMQRKIQDKQNSIRLLQAQVQSLKEQIDNRIGQKDSIIKNLRDTNNRIGGQLRDKITIISRINSPVLTPHLRSPSQSYVGQNYRHDQELRLLSEQMERKQDEIARVKKERQARNKQYRDLEMEYQTLQEQNNKRRIQTNNLKRQLSAIENLELETQNLRTNLAKKNRQIGQLKNSIFELDRIKMDLETSRKEVDKQNQISKMKNKEIEQLTDRNYELQQKIRQKDFKIAQKVEPIVQRNIPDDSTFLQEDIRRKDIEINRLKAENEELNRSIKRETDELQSFKIKYPVKLKMTEEQLLDVKLKLSTIEKKYGTVQNRSRQLQQTLRRVRATAAEELNSESERVKDHFTKLVQRLEDENRNIKEKVREYEVKVNDLELENNSLTNDNKQLLMFKDQNAKKLIVLTQKMDDRDEELRRVRDKGTNQVLKFRKKESKTIQLEAALKSRSQQARQLQKQKQTLRIQLRNLKKQFDDYKHHMLEKMQESTHKQMQNLNKQLNQYQAKFALHNHNFDFKVKDKDSNQVFERTVIYQLKEQNDFLRRELEGRGSNISIDKLKINQMQQETLMKSKEFNRTDKYPGQQEIDFYKQKNKQLEERVNSHIAVNRNLKERIQQLIESSSKSDQTDKIKAKYLELEEMYRSLNQKFNHILEENAYLRNQIGNKDTSQANKFDSELHIEGLQLKLNQVTLERNSFAEELRQAQMDKNHILAKCHELETILTKSQNKITILQSEIERMKDSSSRVQKPVSNENSLKIQIEELRIQNLQKDKEATQERVRSSHFEGECHQLQNYIKDLELQMNYLRQQQTQQKVLSENESTEVQKWKNAFKSLEGSVQMLNEKISQLEGQSEYYKTQAQAQRPGPAIPEDVFYFLELLRSNFMELESLVSEMSIENEEAATIGERILQNSRRGLESCQYVNQLLSN